MSNKAKLAILVLALVLSLVVIYELDSIDSPFVEQPADAQTASEPSDHRIDHQYCMQRSASNGVVFSVGTSCASKEDFEEQETVGVTVSSDGSSKVLTGYEL